MSSEEGGASIRPHASAIGCTWRQDRPVGKTPVAPLFPELGLKVGPDSKWPLDFSPSAGAASKAVDA